MLWGVHIDELALLVDAWVRVFPVDIPDIQPHKHGLQLRQHLVPLALRQQVDVSAHHDDGRLGRPAFDVLHPWLQVSESLLSLQDAPEKQVQRPSGQEALVSCVVLLLGNRRE